MKQKRILFGEMNKVVQFLTLSDLVWYSSVGLVAPFLTIFISEEIIGGDIAKAGFAIAIHLVIRAILQVPVARFADENKGEYDDFLFLFWGTLLSAFAYLGFAFSTYMWQIYLFQAIAAIGSAATIPTWYAIFTRHVDQRRAASQWTFYDTILSIGQALTAGLGGVAIAVLGYKTVFLVVSVFVFTSALFILGIKKSLLKR